MNITYKKPTLRDIPAMQKLVAPEVETGVILSRSNDEIATNIRSYFLAMDGECCKGIFFVH